MDLSARFKIDQTREETFLVSEEHTAYHIGSGESRVLSTPSMISFMEQVAHRLLEADLPEGKISVGIRVDIKHLAATPVQAEVRVKARLVEISGSRMLFEVEAWDEHEKVGEGEHQRAAVDGRRFQESIAKKKRGQTTDQGV